MKYFNSAVVGAFALSFSFTQSAEASLSISPLFALIYNGGEATQIRVSTDEVRPKKYVVGWMYESVPADGSLTEIQEKQNSDTKILEEIISVRPKMFYMGKSRPSTRVIVQENYPALQELQRSQILDGEYRGYIRVNADSVAPLAPEGVAETEEESLSISLQFQYSLAIPVIYRIGDIIVRGRIDSFEFNREDSSLAVKVERQGNAGLYGYVELEGYISNGRKVIFGKSSTSVVTRHQDSEDFSIPIKPSEGGGEVMEGSDLVLRHVPSEDTGTSEPFEISIPYRDAVQIGLINALNGLQ